MVKWGQNSTGRYSHIGVYRVNFVLSNFTYTLYNQVKPNTISAKYPEGALKSLSQLAKLYMHNYNLIFLLF